MVLAQNGVMSGEGTGANFLIKVIRQNANFVEKGSGDAGEVSSDHAAAFIPAMM
jgi:hypothetical protein